MTCDIHIPVLLHETLEYLKCNRGGNFLDCTVGVGGHAKEIAKLVCPRGKVIGIDRDFSAIELAKQNLGEFGDCIILVHGNFTDMDSLLTPFELGQFDGVLLDLGFSSLQVDRPERGFSFMRSGNLDMRMDTRQELTAAKIVNDWPEEEIGRIFREYGEERWWKRIAKAIVTTRKTRLIGMTDELSEIVMSAIHGPARRQAIHPATRVFQALRIAVNGELAALEQALPKAIDLLGPGGRLVIISYHSLEDRIVKQTFARYAKGCICPPDFPVCRCDVKPAVRIITRKVVRSGVDEVNENPRSRSAKLRACEKLGADN